MAGAPTPDRNLQRRIEQLQRDIEHINQQLRAMDRKPVLRPPAHVRMATTFDDGSYPIPNSNVFKIAFQDAEFDPTPGVQTLDLTDRSAGGSTFHTYARTSSGVWVPPDTLVACVELESYDAAMGFWLIIDAETEYEGVTDEDIAANDHGSVSIWLNGLDSGFNVDAHYNWITVLDPVPTGENVVVRWRIADQVWRLVDHGCAPQE